MLIASLLCAAASAAFWFAYIAFYWRHRDRFNEEGRYLDEATLVVHHEQAGVLALPAAVLAVAAGVLLLVWRARRRRSDAA